MPNARGEPRPRAGARDDVTTVAMASTGVYWIPLFDLLEAWGLQGLLSDPCQAKRAPGRPKTDRLDCQWLL